MSCQTNPSELYFDTMFFTCPIEPPRERIYPGTEQSRPRTRDAWFAWGDMSFSQSIRVLRLSGPSSNESSWCARLSDAKNTRLHRHKIRGARPHPPTLRACQPSVGHGATRCWSSRRSRAFRRRGFPNEYILHSLRIHFTTSTLKGTP